MNIPWALKSFGDIAQHLETTEEFEEKKTARVNALQVRWNLGPKEGLLARDYSVSIPPAPHTGKSMFP